VSPRWRPDDSLLERNAKGEIKGVRRVIDALQKNRVRFGNRVVTSRDRGMEGVRKDLRRSPMPPGVQQWQLPVVLGSAGDVLLFMSQYKPGAKVPSHSHTNNLFRIVIEGSLKYRGVTLGPGDWQYVRAGVPYALQAGPDGCVIAYGHGPTPSPWPPGPPGPPGGED
jgi:quercetin dioxygenase-like cupin family protein